MIQRSIHYKSDFKLRLANEIDWSTPFKARFFTTRPVSAMEVSYDGTTYKGCRVDEDGKLVVTFDRFTQLHRQGLGNLMMELSYNIDDDQFADRSFDRILAPQKVVCIDDEDNEFELVLGLNGDSHVEVECSVIAAYKKGDPGDTPEIGENGNWWIGGVDTEVKADYSSEEALRQSQEAARVAAETTRQSNETQRQSGETTRQSNEATRQSKETERQTNETARQNAEAQRQQTFQTNEAARQTAYQNAEANRNGAYEEAEQDRDEEFASKEATRDAANQAALNCAETLSALGPKIDEVRGAVKFEDENTLYITDGAGKVLAKFNYEGLSVIAAKIKDSNGVMRDLKAILAEKQDAEVGKGLSTEDYTSEDKLEMVNLKSSFLHDENGFYICDANGYVAFGVTSDGVVIFNGKESSATIMPNDWVGKVIATYGDSVTEINNGNFEYPYPFDTVPRKRMWANYTAQYYKMSKQYGRGIGSQGYKWTTAGGDGGQLAWHNPTTGGTGRSTEYTYEQWLADPSIKTIPSGYTAIRGCLASWLRITTQFPASIKDTIDVVLVMAHNDTYDATACSFVQNDTTDAEWAASGADYYGKIGGDYNIDTFRGGVASTIMKLQMWMPQAIIVLMTGVSGRAGSAGADAINVNINNSGLLDKAEAIREMGKLASIPVIDTFATDGINGWNRLTYIYNDSTQEGDIIHPYSENGGKMFSRAVIGGLKSILPNY